MIVLQLEHAGERAFKQVALKVELSSNYTIEMEARLGSF